MLFIDIGETTDGQIVGAGYAFIAMTLMLGAIIFYDTVTGDQVSGRVLIPFSVGQTIFWGYKYMNE